MAFQDANGQWYDDNYNQIADPSQGGSGPSPAAPAAAFIPGNQFTNTSPTANQFPAGSGPVVTPGYNGFNGYTQPQLDAINAAGGIAPGSPNSKLVTGYQPPPSGDGNSGSVPQTVAPFSGVNYPTFTPPPLPASLQQPYTLPTAQDLMTNDPGYEARYQLGLNAQQADAAAKGTILNGGEQKAITRYGQDYASGEYNNYVNQTLGQRQQQSSDYLNLAYGPAWQSNQAAVNQYGQLYNQYKDLVSNNQNAYYQNFVQPQLGLAALGLNATTAGAPNPGATGSTQ
jgi:hypothetical protein